MRESAGGGGWDATRLGCAAVVWARRRRRRRMREPVLGTPESLARAVLRTGPKRADDWRFVQEEDLEQDDRS